MAVIGKIRERSILLVILIALAILAFLLMDISGPGGAQAGSTEVGEVNGIALSSQEYSNRLDRAYNNARSTNPSLDEATRLNLKKSVWDGYVKDVLAENEYAEAGIFVTQTEMRDLLFGNNPPASITSAPIFQGENGQYDPQLLRNYMSQMMDSEDQTQRNYFESVFLESLKRNRKAEKYNSAISQAFYVPTAIAEARGAANSVSADIQYVKIPYTTIPDSEISFTDSDLKAYINANKEEFTQEATRSIDYVVFDVEPSPEDIQVTREYVDNLAADLRTTQNLEAFLTANSDTRYADNYQTRAQIGTDPKIDDYFTQPVGTVIPTEKNGNAFRAVKIVDRRMVPDSVAASHILIKVDPGQDPAVAEARIDSIKRAIDSGSISFEDAASTLSEDVGSASKEGSLGTFAPGRMVKPFNDYVFYEGKEGDMGIVQSQFGYHLIRIDESEPTQEAIKLGTLSRQIAPSSKTINAASRRAGEFAGRNQSSAQFRAAAENDGLTVESADDFERYATAIGSLGANESIASWAFRSDIGDVSPVFETDGGDFVIAILTNKKMAGLADVDDVRARVESEIKKQKKAEKIKARISGGDLNAIANEFNTTVESESGIRFSSASVGSIGREPKVIAAATALDQGKTSKPIAGQQGVYVIEVTNRSGGTAGDVASTQRSEKTRLSSGVSFQAPEALLGTAELEDKRDQVLRVR